MNTTRILKNAYIAIDGVPMRASIEALRVLPAVPRLIREGHGCWYDDGTTTEWITRTSTIDFILDEGTTPPKIPTLTDLLYDELAEHLSDCWQRGVNPVLELVDGTIHYSENAL
ncbi:MAG: hypothetical protein E7J87_10285 [Streptococcus sp.]|uniref:hypothetical protein n=1 Tax=Streptococcus sp. TaxID=1306 RepID=UPI00291265C7|nr:hypothetical protein [Streptococcus sp.]MDU7731120.1 hypothetical protein [Actinomyces sp.]MDU7740288.1 hypothetical protein [Streptococcus sp.]